MNVLILNSSPRKGGNSDVLCQQFAKGAEEAGIIMQLKKVSKFFRNIKPFSGWTGYIK